MNKEGLIKLEVLEPKHLQTSFRVFQDKAPGLKMPRLHQLDDYSCGFLACLSVVYHFTPLLDVADAISLAERVLSVTSPHPDYGCDQKKVIQSLAKFGIKAKYRKGLEPLRIAQLVANGLPVIVTIQPEGWDYDHWTVVRGFDIHNRVYLTNYDGLDSDGSLSWEEFDSIWESRGEGLICRLLS